MNENKHMMFIQQPAIRWEDALPSGNGVLGAMVYGNIHREKILLNRENLWLPLFDRPELPDMAPYLPEYRRLLEECRFQEADRHWCAALKKEGWPDLVYTNPFHPAFDFLLEQRIDSVFKNYKRALDFRSGEVTVSWEENGAAFTRKLFVSRADNVIVMHISCDEKQRISIDAAFAGHEKLQDNRKAYHYPRYYKPEEIPVSYETKSIDEWLFIDAKYNNGYGYFGTGKVINFGGEIKHSKGCVNVCNADEILVIIDISPNRQHEAAIKELQGKIDSLPKNYDALIEKHRQLHFGLYNRLNFDLHDDTNPGKGNEELLAAAYRDHAPALLINKLYNYGRYLFISSTNEDGLPPNLQGIWNGDYIPAWSCDYTQDENVQMNHWHVLSGNLAELMIPYFKYYEATLDDWRENAMKLFGCRGVYAPLRQSDNGLMSENMPYQIWASGAGWLARMFYDYWLYTGDRDFLEKRTVPFLKEVALFYEDFLYEGKDGKLVICPSMSAENIPDYPGATRPTVNPTMDIAVCREVLTSLCEACEFLETDKDNVSRWNSILKRLPDYEINEDGAIREWIWEGHRDNYHHRHQSHIYPLFPGFEVTREKTPGLFEACRAAVEKRLVVGIKSQTGWSLAHMANIYCRLAEGDRALECLDIITRSCLGINFLTYHNDWRMQGITDNYGGMPPFQIDANFGMVAAVQEMLVFSLPGTIKVLPALPSRWEKGSIRGMVCRGQVEISIYWDKASKAILLDMKSKSPGSVTMQFPDWIGEVKCCDNDVKIEPSCYGKQYRSIRLPEGKVVRIEGRCLHGGYILKDR